MFRDSHCPRLGLGWRPFSQGVKTGALPSQKSLSRGPKKKKGGGSLDPSKEHFKTLTTGEHEKAKKTPHERGACWRSLGNPPSPQKEKKKTIL